MTPDCRYEYAHRVWAQCVEMVDSWAEPPTVAELGVLFVLVSVAFAGLALYWVKEVGR